MPMAANNPDEYFYKIPKSKYEELLNKLQEINVKLGQVKSRETVQKEGNDMWQKLKSDPRPRIHAN